MKKLTVVTLVLAGLAALSIAACTVILDTQSLTEPCSTDVDCKEGFRCEEGTCLPGPRLDAGTVQDAALADTQVADTHVNDAAVADTHVADTHVNDAAVADTHVNDSAVADTHVEDSTVIDAAPEDTGVEDTASAG